MSAAGGAAVNGSAELLSLEPTNSQRFEHRQLSLDAFVAQEEEEPAVQIRMELRPQDEDMFTSHSHVHHHLRHHHSIYSRNYSFQGSQRNRLSVDAAAAGHCTRHSCSCSLLVPDSYSPKRRSSGAVISTPRSPTTPVPLSPAISETGDESVDGPSVEIRSYDRIDSMPQDMSFTWFDIIALLLSIVTFLVDIGTDTVVAAFHLHNKDYWYFSLTVAFIAIPTLIVTGISLRWYVLDAREEGSPPISAWKWATRVIFLLLQLGPIIRYFDSLIYGIKFRWTAKNRAEQRKYYQYMVYEDTDATMLRLFECFMEAAPQLVLQLYIMVKKSSEVGEAEHVLFVIAQVCAVFASLISLSWSLVSYQRALRMSQPDKCNMTWPGLIVQFLWRICMIGSRVLALALFAARFKAYVALICAIHWFSMFAWIISMRTKFCDNRMEELGYNAVLAVMFIFCYFNPVDSPTRYRFTIFYTVMFLENTLLMSLYFTHHNSLKDWFRVPAMFVHFAAFFIGIVIMIIYYLYFHPTGSIRIFRDRNEVDGVTIRHDCVDEDTPQSEKRRKVSSQVWMNSGRAVLHPRPAVPNFKNHSNNHSTNTTEIELSATPVKK